VRFSSEALRRGIKGQGRREVSIKKYCGLGSCSGLADKQFPLSFIKKI
jgi:hypothetical protein